MSRWFRYFAVLGILVTFIIQVLSRLKSLCHSSLTYFPTVNTNVFETCHLLLRKRLISNRTSCGTRHPVDPCWLLLTLPDLWWPLVTSTWHTGDARDPYVWPVFDPLQVWRNPAVVLGTYYRPVAASGIRKTSVKKIQTAVELQNAAPPDVQNSALCHFILVSTASDKEKILVATAADRMTFSLGKTVLGLHQCVK